MESQAVNDLLFEHQIRGDQSWGPEFRAGIHAITALGSCLIVVAHPKAALIRLPADEANG
jgi:hypothetical protein